MLDKIALSLTGGVVLLFVLTVIGININSSDLGNSQQKTVTVLRNDGSTDVVSGNCEQVPQVYRQYCNNVSVKDYELFLKLENVKDVPDNPYIQGLQHTQYLQCLVGVFDNNSGCNVDYVELFDKVEPSFLDTIILIFEMAGSVVICSYTVYFLGNKFLWDNKRK
jgi:hypothetical protein